VVEILSEVRISRAVPKLIAEMLARKPAGAASMGHDVRDWFAVDGQGHSLAGLNGVNYLAG